MKDTPRIDNFTSSIDRRNFLQSAGTVAGAGILASGIGSAVSSKKEKYVGYTYDPETRAIYGSASAEITQLDEKLEGVYQFDNANGEVVSGGPKRLTIPVSSHTRARRPAPSGQPDGIAYRARVGGDFLKRSPAPGKGYEKGAIPLVVETHSAADRNLTGEVRYPDEVVGVGFAVEPVSEHTTNKQAREKVLEALQFRQQVSYKTERKYPGRGD